MITLIHLRDSSIAKQWIYRAEAPAVRLPHASRLVDDYPREREEHIKLYKFQFRPMVFVDLALLSIAYLLILVHLVLSLSKPHTIKS